MPCVRLCGCLYMKRRDDLEGRGGKGGREGVRGCGMQLFHAGVISCLFKELMRPVFICES